MRLLIEADGGSRGNPGPAGYGAVLYDAFTEDKIAECYGYLGKASNNVAEYRGLIAGLRLGAKLHAARQEVSAVLVKMDSMLVVEQMSGHWRIKHPDMAQHAEMARDLASVFPSVVYLHVPREQNGTADALANLAMDEALVWPGFKYHESIR